MKLSKTSLCIFAAALFLLSAIVVQAQVTAVRAGKLVDPETGTVSINQTIIVEDGKIKAIGPSVPVPAGATVIDLSTSTVLPGLFDSTFIDSFVEAGVPAKDTLRIMTTNAARLLGVDKERGAIKVGQAADIIATAENPLDNIQTLKQVSFVMKNGKVFKPVK